MQPGSDIRGIKLGTIENENVFDERIVPRQSIVFCGSASALGLLKQIMGKWFVGWYCLDCDALH